MDNYGANEIKTQLIRFFFSSFSNIGVACVELLYNNENIKYRYNNHSDIIDEESIEYEFTLDNWNNFINKLFEIKINNWKKRYEQKYFQFDGEEWKIEMEFKKLPKFISTGYDEYPYNWENFKNIIKEYFPQIEYLKIFD